jgi:MFS superfamily sulfate permease-like transporter
VRLGYLAGIALTVLATQLPKLLGIPLSAESFVEAVRELPGDLDQTDPVALAIGAASLAAILLIRRAAPKVPGVFIAVAGATILVAALGLADEITVVGRCPRGCRA